MRKLLIILTFIIFIFAHNKYNACYGEIKGFSGFITCLNGEEFLIWRGERKGGITKTGHKCVCKKVPGKFFGTNIIAIRIK